VPRLSPPFPPYGLAWRRRQLLLLVKTNLLPVLFAAWERGRQQASARARSQQTNPPSADCRLPGEGCCLSRGCRISLERRPRQGQRKSRDTCPHAHSHPVGRGRETALLDSLEKLRKEFMVPILVSILSFHRCPVTAARQKKGVAMPGRSLCPSPRGSKPVPCAPARGCAAKGRRWSYPSSLPARQLDVETPSRWGGPGVEKAPSAMLCHPRSRPTEMQGCDTLPVAVLAGQVPSGTQRDGAWANPWGAPASLEPRGSQGSGGCT